MIWRFALGLLVAAAIVVIGLQIRENSGQPATGPTGPTTVLVPIVGSPTTPLRDSGPENNAPRKGKPRTAGVESRSRGSNSAGDQLQRRVESTNPLAPRSVGKRSKPRKPPKAHSPPRRPDRPEKPGNSPQPGNQPPPSKPPPVVTVPSVCVNGLVEVGDC